MKSIRVLGALVLLGALGACGGVDGPRSTGNMSLSFATHPAGSVAKTGGPSMIAGADTTTLNGSTLVVTRAELVLKHLELEAEGDSVACGDDEGDRGGEH